MVWSDPQEIVGGIGFPGLMGWWAPYGVHCRAMEWSDDGIVLSARKHGESAAIVSLLTREHGRHAGLVRGGTGRKLRGVLQPGNLVAACWRARLPEHLGTYTCEPLHAYAAEILDTPLQLAALASACALAETALPEREPHRAVFDGLKVVLDALDVDWWPSIYVKWELGLLAELGFGLDLRTCAATGRMENLAYVSPKSGRAVSREAAAPYKEILLPLPGFLLGGGGAGDHSQVAEGLRLTGFFLERYVYHGPLPPARERLLARMEAAARQVPPPQPNAPHWNAMC